MKGHLSRLARLAGWRNLRWALVAPAVPFVLWACTAKPLQEPDPRPESQNDQYYEVNPIRDLDIVFLVDNSHSMKEEQSKLAARFADFIQPLKDIPGPNGMPSLPNVRIGVISSNVGAGPAGIPGTSCNPGGDRGVFQAKAGCNLDPAAKFIVSTDLGNGQRQNNFTGDITTVFSCMAQLGIDGCGYEHQLQAIRLALYSEGDKAATPENRGFLDRPQAYLAIIILTDEDDCSADPRTELFGDEAQYPEATEEASLRCAIQGHVCNGQRPPHGAFNAPISECKEAEDGKLIKVQEIINDVLRVKPRGADQILVSAIMGWRKQADANNPPPYAIAQRADRLGADGKPRFGLMPACGVAQPDQDNAMPGLRIKRFVEAFGGDFYSICENDYKPAMQQIGQRLASKISKPCLDATPVDIDTNMGGTQADCRVIDRVPSMSGTDDNALPQCGGNATKPCWTLVADNACGGGYRIDVDRNGMTAPKGTQQVIKCATCPSPDPVRCPR